MSIFRILDINLRINRSTFESESQAFVNNYMNNYGEKMNLWYKQIKTKHGKNMLKIIVENDNNDIFEVIAEEDFSTGDLSFEPFEFSNMRYGFYNIACDSDVFLTEKDPTVFTNALIWSLCVTCKGTYASMKDDDIMICKDGKKREHKAIAVIDTDGDVYSVSGAKKISGETGDNIDFSVTKPISEWLGEHPEITSAIGKLSLTDKMNYIGKYLISARVNDKIDSDEFIDIFRQAGIIGFSDPSTLNIYKLLM